MNSFTRIMLVSLIPLGLLFPASAAWADSDDLIKGRVEAALMLSPVLSSRSIDVEIEDGAAKLTGTIGGSLERELAVAVASSMPGVDSVEEGLDLQQGNGGSPEATQRAETQASALINWRQAHIAAQLRQDFADSPALEGENIDFRLEGDTLVLEGEVESELERMVATQLSQRLDDVSVVDNRLEVLEETAPAEQVEMPESSED